jgi:excisionase family DNA binding protein
MLKKTSSSKNSVVVLPPANVDLLTIRETAAVLRLSVSCVRAWVLHRRIPFVKIHNKVIRFRREDVNALIAASVVPAHSAKTDRLKAA